MNNSMIPMLVTMFGSGFGASAQVRAGNSEAGLATYNAKVADANARMEDFNAVDASQRGYADETTHRIGVKQFIGKQRTSLAAQGQDLSSGTALELQQDTALQGEKDALTIRANAARESWGYKKTAYNDRVQAEDLRMQAKIAKQRGRNAGVQTILTDASQLLYQKFGKK